MNSSLHGTLFCCLGATFLLGACSSVPEEKASRKPPVMVGKVSKVFPQQGFVLIQQEKTVSVPAKDTVLLSQGQSGERISNLVVSAERMNKSPHFPADIRSGSPAMGDFVFLYESLENGAAGVSVLTPSEDGSITKPEDIRFPAMEEPDRELSKDELNSLLNDGAKMPE